MSIYGMKGFKEYVNEDDDVAKTIAKIPPHHQILVKGYRFEFEPGNTLKGDKGHVGLIMNKPERVIRIAAPWNYGREFTLLHEIAHLVHELYIKGTPLEKEWAAICKATPDRKKDESPEELFCHGYACHFAKNKIAVHDHPEWHGFMDKICRIKKRIDKNMVP